MSDEKTMDPVGYFRDSIVEFEKRAAWAVSHGTTLDVDPATGLVMAALSLQLLKDAGDYDEWMSGYLELASKLS